MQYKYIVLGLLGLFVVLALFASNVGKNIQSTWAGAWCMGSDNTRVDEMTGMTKREGCISNVKNSTEIGSSICIIILAIGLGIYTMIAADPIYHHMTYKTFMKETGIIPVTIAILLGLSGQQMTKQFVTAVVMPIFTALRTMKKPMVHIGDFLPSVIVFGLAIGISAVLIKAFLVHKKTVPFVQVWDDKDQ